MSRGIADGCFADARLSSGESPAAGGQDRRFCFYYGEVRKKNSTEPFRGEKKKKKSVRCLLFSLFFFHFFFPELENKHLVGEEGECTHLCGGVVTRIAQPRTYVASCYLVRRVHLIVASREGENNGETEGTENEIIVFEIIRRFVRVRYAMEALSVAVVSVVGSSHEHGNGR